MNVEQEPMYSGAAPYPGPLVREYCDLSGSAAITVMLASHRKDVRAAWLPMLSCESGIEIKGEPGLDATCVARCVQHHLPKVLLLDKALLDEVDPQSLRTIREQSRHVSVLLLLDGIFDGLVDYVLRNRFNGFLMTTCPPDVSLKAIRAVSKGELWLSRAAMALAIADLPEQPSLGDVGAPAGAIRFDKSETLTPRESQVVALVRTGCINKEIARDLGITEGTVKKHLQSVFAKLGVHRRTLVALGQLPNSGATRSITQSRMRTRGASSTSRLRLG